MYSLEEITRVENQYHEGAPSLGRALDMLRSRWGAGARDEETALRLLFLLWYRIVEPIHLTGLPREADGSLFREVFEEAGGESAGPVVLFAVGKMAEMFPWALGDENEWAALAGKYMKKALESLPDISADTFAGRGAAGDYFQHILSYELRRA
jgi:hypothetical protein